MLLQTGPYWPLALHYVNVWTLYLTPVYLAAVGTVLYFSWTPPQRDWVLLRYFIVQVCEDAAMLQANTV